MSELIETGFNGFGIDEFADDYDEFTDLMDELRQDRDDLVDDVSRMLLQERVHPDAFSNETIIETVNMFEFTPEAQDILDLLLKIADDDELYDIGRIKQEAGL